MADNISSAAFLDDRNQGFQLAYNSGRVDVNYHVLQSGVFFRALSLKKGANVGLSWSAQEFKPRPCFTVPSPRDDGFICRDTLAEIHARCAQPAARVALVGLGGVG